jgi:hypothetical protein
MELDQVNIDRFHCFQKLNKRLFSFKKTKQNQFNNLHVEIDQIELQLYEDLNRT